MKRVVSIFAVALMGLGFTSYVLDNTANEFDFMQDLSTMLACDYCDQKVEERDNPIA